MYTPLIIASFQTQPYENDGVVKFIGSFGFGLMASSDEQLELGIWNWPVDRPETYLNIAHEML
jgi:hypothetical protein